MRVDYVSMKSLYVSPPWVKCPPQGENPQNITHRLLRSCNRLLLTAQLVFISTACIGMVDLGDILFLLFDYAYKYQIHEFGVMS